MAQIGQAPPWQAFVVESGLPTHLESGRTYKVVLLLRNDGARVWPAREVKIGYHWLLGVDDAPAQVVEWEGERTKLPRDVGPGQMVAVEALVKATLASGAPLAPQTDGKRHYRLAGLPRRNGPE